MVCTLHMCFAALPPENYTPAQNPRQTFPHVNVIFRLVVCSRYVTRHAKNKTPMFAPSMRFDLACHLRITHPDNPSLKSLATITLSPDQNF